MNEVSLKPDSSKQVCLVGVMAYSWMNMYPGACGLVDMQRMCMHWSSSQWATMLFASHRCWCTLRACCPPPKGFGILWVRLMWFSSTLLMRAVLLNWMNWRTNWHRTSPTWTVVWGIWGSWLFMNAIENRFRSSLSLKRGHVKGNWWHMYSWGYRHRPHGPTSFK